MLPNLDIFVLVTVEAPSMDKKYKHLSMIKPYDEGARGGIKNGVSGGDFRTLKPP